MDIVFGVIWSLGQSHMRRPGALEYLEVEWFLDWSHKVVPNIPLESASER